ncbi:MAG: O-acetyl-ADP-ribose deacetylase [Bacteroidota bacterium]
MLLKVIREDITKMEVAAIINAANSSLLGGGGVDGAIHRAGGSQILEECLKIRARRGGCAVGEAVITNAGKLPCKKVIHTVGPVWVSENADKLDQLLANCYKNSLTLAQENNLRTVAFPNISTGVYRYPKQRAAKVAITAVKDYLLVHPSAFDQIIFVCFDKANYQIYEQKINVN